MFINRRSALIGTLAAAGFGDRARAAGLQPGAPPAPRAPAIPQDPTETIELWPNGAPGAPPRLPVEAIHARSTDPVNRNRYILGIARPRLIVFRPQSPNGASALVIQGGGYGRIVLDSGYAMGRLLADRGVTAFILLYRLPSEGWAAGADAPLADAQRAVRLIRHRAAAYRLDPQRLVTIGFSAGGHVAADLITRFNAAVYQRADAADALSARPDAGAAIYPVISMRLPSAHAGSRRNLIGADASPDLERAHSPDLNVRPDSPATFLLHAEDDLTVGVENSLLFRAALRAAGVETETHLFPEGGHGFGVHPSRASSVSNWPILFYAWGGRRGLWS